MVLGVELARIVVLRGQGRVALCAAVAAATLAGIACANAASPDKTPAPAKSAPAKPAAAAPQPPAPTPAEVAAAAEVRKQQVEAEKARCTALIKGLAINATLKEPIEEGECGTLAPLEVVSVGSAPAVVFSPPAVMTCDLARELVGWMKDDVQPLARQYFKRPIAKVEVMSSYSCRHAYNRVRNRLSEHGHANAVDIRGFVTDKGETAYVLEDWGMTSSEIAAASAAAQKVQAAKAAAEAERQLAAAKAAAEAARVKSAAQAPSGPSVMAPNPLANAKTLIEGLSSDAQVPSMALTPPSRLGGPKSKDKQAGAAGPAQQAAVQPGEQQQPPTAKSLFLRAVHDKACLRFGTTLGPEANAAHRNHLHVDMAERKVRKICDN